MKRFILSAVEERELARRWRRTGDQAALARLVEGHIGQVVKTAVKDFGRSGASRRDLIQEGHVGLLIAARRFDPERGLRLSTYANFWIRAFMMNHVVESYGPLRSFTTRAARKVFFNLGKARARVIARGEVVANDVLARELGVSEEAVVEARSRLVPYDVQLDAWDSASHRHVGANLAADASSPEDVVVEENWRASLRADLSRRMQRLSPRERAIVEARHLVEEPVTLKALGKRFGVSRERVRQIERAALAKLLPDEWDGPFSEDRPPGRPRSPVEDRPPRRPRDRALKRRRSPRR